MPTKRAPAPLRFHSPADEDAWGKVVEQFLAVKKAKRQIDRSYEVMRVTLRNELVNRGGPGAIIAAKAGIIGCEEVTVPAHAVAEVTYLKLKEV